MKTVNIFYRSEIFFQSTVSFKMSMLSFLIAVYDQLNKFSSKNWKTIFVNMIKSLKDFDGRITSLNKNCVYSI